MIRKIAWVTLGLEIASIATVAVENGFSSGDLPPLWFAPIANTFLIAWLLYLIWATVNIAMGIKSKTVSIVALACYMGAAIFSMFIPTKAITDYTVEFNIAVVVLVICGNALLLIKLITDPSDGNNK